jgi:hypothetical protein
MDVDSDMDNNNRTHGDFRPDAGRKREEVTTSIQAMANERRARPTRRQEVSRYKAKLTQWINEIKWSGPGIPSTYRDSATALLVIFNLMLEEVNLIQVEATAKSSVYLGRGHSTLDTRVAYWHKYEKFMSHFFRDTFLFILPTKLIQ